MRIQGLVAGAAVVVTVGIGACGGGRNTECRYEPWRGTCQLVDVRHIQIVEAFPRSFSVLEAIYDAKVPGSVISPQFRQEFRTPAIYEEQFVRHLKANAAVSCEGQDARGSCPKSGSGQALLPMFTPSDTDATVAALGPVGCEKLDQVLVNNPAAAQGTAISAAGGSVMQERFEFEAGSEATTARHAEIARGVAQLMQANPKIECIAIVGQISRDEPIPLAENRARAVRQLITGHGIDARRFVTHGATVPMSGGQGQAVGAPVDPKLRSVRMSVLLVSQ